MVQAVIARGSIAIAQLIRIKIGRATTSAVVISICLIIFANLCFAILFNWTLAGP